MGRKSSCCLCFSTRTGTLLTGGLGLIFALMSTFAYGVGLYNETDVVEYVAEQYRNSLDTEDMEILIKWLHFGLMVFLGIAVLAVFNHALLFVGTLHKKSALMLPWIVCNFVYNIIVTGMLICAGAFNALSLQMTTAALIGSAVFHVILASSVWYMWTVVLAHYKDLRDEELERDRLPLIVNSDYKRLYV